MLTADQKEKIKLEYKDFALMSEYGYMNGIAFMLEVIGESKFKDYLEIKFMTDSLI